MINEGQVKQSKMRAIYLNLYILKTNFSTSPKSIFIINFGQV